MRTLNIKTCLYIFALQLVRLFIICKFLKYIYRKSPLSYVNLNPFFCIYKSRCDVHVITHIVIPLSRLHFFLEFCHGRVTLNTY